jgi:hypothetical protein
MQYDFQPGDTVRTAYRQGVVRAVSRNGIVVDMARPDNANAWDGISRTFAPASLRLVAHGPRDRSFWSPEFGATPPAR